MHLSLQSDLIQRYTLPGQVLLDPFGGIGGLLLATVMPEPRHVILCELEEKFCKAAQQNSQHLQNRLPGIEIGHALIIQADSRHLPLCSADIVCSSPPYLDARHVSTVSPGGGENIRYSADPRNIGNLRSTAVDIVCSSPPYAGSTHKPGNLEAMREKLEELYPGHVGPNSLRNATEYGEHAQQIGNLPHGNVVVACGSPPFGAMNAPTAGGRITQRPAKDGQGFDGDREHFVYSEESASNIGNLPYVAVACGSPPYERAITQGGETDAWRAKYGYQGDNAGYSTSTSNIGNAKSEGAESYATAVLAVYRECYRIVKSGGLLLLVVGNYVRDGKEIDLATDTITLAEAAGWTLIERWKHVKSRISFWRILHAKKRPDAPVIVSEDVLVFAKHYQGWEFTDLPPTTTAPVQLSTAKQEITAIQHSLFGES